jgi:hypothetical protein
MSWPDIWNCWMVVSSMPDILDRVTAGNRTATGG